MKLVGSAGWSAYLAGVMGSESVVLAILRTQHSDSEGREGVRFVAR